MLRYKRSRLQVDGTDKQHALEYSVTIETEQSTKNETTSSDRVLPVRYTKRKLEFQQIDGRMFAT
jgi:hypothetical protein